MTKIQTALLSFLAIVVAGLIAKFVPDMGATVAAPLAGLGILGLGYVMRNPWDKAAIAAAQTTETRTETITAPSNVTPIRSKDETP